MFSPHFLSVALIHLIVPYLLYALSDQPLQERFKPAGKKSFVPLLSSVNSTIRKITRLTASALNKSFINLIIKIHKKFRQDKAAWIPFKLFLKLQTYVHRIIHGILLFIQNPVTSGGHAQLLFPAMMTMSSCSVAQTLWHLGSACSSPKRYQE